MPNIYRPDPEDLAQAQEEMARYVRDCEQENREWEAKWPAHCKDCGGWGGSTHYEMHGFNYGPGEQIFDVCEATTHCHRCGQDGLDDDLDGPCKFCGWNYDDGLRDCSI